MGSGKNIVHSGLETWKHSHPAKAAMAYPSWVRLVARTHALLSDHDDLKGIIRAASAGDMLAVRDRNSLEGEWRNVRLLRLDDTFEEVHWRLLTEHGVVIDEPDDGCPAAGLELKAGPLLKGGVLEGGRLAPLGPALERVRLSA